MTGNMTLSVVAEGGLRILTVDMLAQDTMKHDTNGDRLARALNDLTLIAVPSTPLPHPDAGISPTPWSATVDANRRRIAVRGAGGRLIAGHMFGRTRIMYSTYNRSGVNCSTMNVPAVPGTDVGEFFLFSMDLDPTSQALFRCFPWNEIGIFHSFIKSPDIFQFLNPVNKVLLDPTRIKKR
jgi:hypothetical protein